MSLQSLVFETRHLNGLPVNIMKLNPVKPRFDHSFTKLILVIPGNPGLVGYYEEFVKVLFNELDDGCTSVWAISHACHTLNISNIDEKVSHHNPLDVEIEHKLRFIENEIPSNCKLILVGHSIGCYMILLVLQILKGLKERTIVDSTVIASTLEYSQIYSRIVACYFLFPTIERMRESPNGKRMWPILKYFQKPLTCLVAIVSLLPISFRSKLVTWYLGRKYASSSMVLATLDLITPRIFGNMLRLAHNELREVNELNPCLLAEVKDKLTFYFGSADGWCPLKYRDELLQEIPTIKTFVDMRATEHAFVLKSSVEMAHMVANFITSSYLL